MYKSILIRLLAVLFVAVSCSENSERKQREVTPCECKKNADKVEDVMNLSLSLNYAHKLTDLNLNFYGLYANPDSLENFGDSIYDFSNSELDSLKRVQNLNISPHLIDQIIYSQSFMINLDHENRLLDAPELGYAKAEDTAFVKEYIVNNSENLVNFDVKLVWGANEETHFKEPGFYALYAVEYNSFINIKDIERAEVTYNQHTNNKDIVLILKKTSVNKWTEFSTKHVGQFVAIVFNQKVILAPRINEPMTSGKISISGQLNDIETKKLSDLINCKVMYVDMGHKNFLESIKECN